MKRRKSTATRCDEPESSAVAYRSAARTVERACTDFAAVVGGEERVAGTRSVVENEGDEVGNSAANAVGARCEEQKDVPTAQTARRGEVAESEDRFRSGRRFSTLQPSLSTARPCSGTKCR